MSVPPEAGGAALPPPMEPAPLRYWLYAVTAFAALFAACLPTLLWPYLLADETWLVLPRNHAIADRLGRYIFSGFALAGAKAYAAIGLDMIVPMRLLAMAGLAMAAAWLARWLELWGQDRLTALGLAVAAMTLPAFQMVVAGGAPLAFAILFAVMATVHFQRTYPARRPIDIAAVAGLLLMSLLIYQQQMLLAFAMLAVPLLSGRTGRPVWEFAIRYSVLLIVTAVAYFAVWRTIFLFKSPDPLDERYGPEAVRLPDFDQAVDFVAVRLPQIADLWWVTGPAPGIAAALTAVLIAVKAVADLRAERARAWNLAGIAALAVLADGFSILARNYPSYVSSPPLTFLVFYCAACGAIVLAGRLRGPAAVAVACAGVLAAHVTLREHMAIANNLHMTQVRAAILASPEADDFHILGTPTGTGRQEFGWRNASIDFYMGLAAGNVADDLVLKGEISPERRARLRFSVGRVETRLNPGSTATEAAAGAVTIDLEPR